VEEAPARRGILHRVCAAAAQLTPHAVQTHCAQVLHGAGAQHVLEAVVQLAAAGPHPAAQVQHGQRLVGLRQHQFAGTVNQLSARRHRRQRRGVHPLGNHLQPLDEQGVAHLAQGGLVLPGGIRVQQARHQLHVQAAQGLRGRGAGGHHQLVLQPRGQGLLVHALPQGLQQIGLHHHGHQGQLRGRAQVQLITPAQQHGVEFEALTVEDAGF